MSHVFLPSAFFFSTHAPPGGFAVGCWRLIRALALPRSLALVETVDYTFCDPSGPPKGLRVSSGELVFGDSADGRTCLASTIKGDRNTPRIDADVGDQVWGDVEVALEFYQLTHYRDSMVCGRTQSAPGQVRIDRAFVVVFAILPAVLSNPPCRCAPPKGVCR